MALNLDEVRTKPLLCLLSSSTTSSCRSVPGHYIHYSFHIVSCGLLKIGVSGDTEGIPSALIAAPFCLSEGRPKSESNASPSCTMQAHLHKSLHGDACYWRTCLCKQLHMAHGSLEQHTLDRVGSMGSSSSYSSRPKLRGEPGPRHFSAITSCALPAHMHPFFESTLRATGGY